MKHFFKIIIAFTVVFFSSCEAEDNLSSNSIELEEQAVTNIEQRTTVNTDLLENEMQWVSYLLVQTLQKESNRLSREYLQNLPQSNNANILVKLEDLLENSNFRRDFEVEFYYYYLYDSEDFLCNNGVPGRPRGNPTPASRPDVDGRIAYSAFDLYLISITQDDCFEVLLPNGYNTSEARMISTAHPLNTDLYNQGFDVLNNCDTNVTNVNTLYTNNVLIVRPFVLESNLGSQNCDYSQYGNLDFTHFFRD
jgi:hypothetical protein